MIISVMPLSDKIIILWLQLLLPNLTILIQSQAQHDLAPASSSWPTPPASARMPGPIPGLTLGPIPSPSLGPICSLLSSPIWLNSWLKPHQSAQPLQSIGTANSIKGHSHFNWQSPFNQLAWPIQSIGTANQINWHSQFNQLAESHFNQLE